MKNNTVRKKAKRGPWRFYGKDTTNYTHGLSHTKFYRRWQSMRHRCERHEIHPNYALRNTRYVPEWASFENFKNDMYESYLEHVAIHGERNTTLDRIDNSNGEYSKSNCRWATMLVQVRNRELSVNYNGESAKEAALRLGGHPKTVENRVYKGWSLERAFTEPINRNFQAPHPRD